MPKPIFDQAATDNWPLKVARAVSLFGVLPSLAFILALSLEDIDNLRPHGTTAFVLFSYGFAAPALLFLYNSKMRKFARNYISDHIPKWHFSKRRQQIVPIV